MIIIALAPYNNATNEAGRPRRYVPATQGSGPHGITKPSIPQWGSNL